MQGFAPLHQVAVPLAKLRLLPGPRLLPVLTSGLCMPSLVFGSRWPIAHRISLDLLTIFRYLLRRESEMAQAETSAAKVRMKLVS